MKFIRGVEIRYFRSIHNARLTECRDLNVLSGRNDVGKSNFLKALNLFFNGQTDWGDPVRFARDFCAKRRDEVRSESIKGKQFISITLEFERPENYAGSLPARFRVTRTWLRASEHHEQRDDLERQLKRGALPCPLTTARRFLSQFLNRMRYEYVPAVKDRAYSAHLLERLQSHLLRARQGDDIRALVDKLANDLDRQLEVLRDDFHVATGVETKVSPPNDVASLFQAFQVSTMEPTAQQLGLDQHGDGIQARYLPSVLSFISARSSHFFVWGFEEPENSLEYRHCMSLADKFAADYSRNAQIFVTSHSPAFTVLKRDNVTCFRCVRRNEATEPVRVYPPTPSDDGAAQLGDDLGLVELAEVVGTQYAMRLSEWQALTERVQELQHELDAKSRPILIVEGKTDETILGTAWAALYGQEECPFIIRDADPAGGKDGGAGGAEAVLKAVESLHPQEGRRVVGLLDHDDEGKRCYDKLSANFGDVPGVATAKGHKNGLAYALMLPVPDNRKDHAEAGTLSLEYYFADDVLENQVEGRGLSFSDTPLKVIKGAKVIPLSDEELKKVTEQIPCLPGYRRIASGKAAFANSVVPTLPSCAFEPFRSLFETVARLLEVALPQQ